MKEGKKLYFVPSLYENGIRVTIISVIDCNPNLKNRRFITAVDKAGNIYKAYENMFSVKKPVPFDGGIE